MRISEYSFGSITVDGERYVKDVIVLPESVLSPWWRKEGHNLLPEDLEEAVAAAPELLVVGTGKFGAMKVPAETVQFLKSKGIEVLVEKTGKAVELFNSAPKDKKTVAAFHLTC